jgi:hypothetical protein
LTARTKTSAADAVPTVESLSKHEIALIKATRRIPAPNGERYRRTMAVIDHINALADGMRSVHA